MTVRRTLCIRIGIEYGRILRPWFDGTMAKKTRQRRKVPAKQAAAQPAEQRANHTLVSVKRQQWEAPIPPPAILAEFDQIVPGSASRIIGEFETEAEHRRGFEKRALFIEGFERISSRIFALLFALAALAIAGYCAYLDQPEVASIIGGATIVSVVTALIYQNKK
jgi:uncharacterized membrane protein